MLSQPLSVLFGGIVGLSLGLTGGGGSIFAAPLLVYGLGVPPKEAVTISLAAVGTTSFVGFLQRLRGRQVEVVTGLVFSIAGVVGTPLGKSIGDRLPDSAMMVLFSGLMLFIAGRMWLKSRESAEASAAFLAARENAPATPLGCSRDPEGKIDLTTRCAVVLMLLGVVVGILSGIFGIGGGFVIVPALVLFTSMRIHQAVATSLMVISLVSAGGLATFLLGGREIDVTLTLLFIAGGVLGMQSGLQIGKRLSPKMMQQVFAVAIVFVAAFVIAREVLGAG